MAEFSPAAHLRNQKYISLATFRRSGQEVRTPVWFAQQADKLYVMTRNDSGKFKRVRNQSHVRIAPCTARGKVTGAWIDGQARILDREQEGLARQPLARKYFLMRVPWLWSKKNIFLEITLPSA
jgi:PPOX class probable F420-dependent enzyme